MPIHVGGTETLVVTLIVLVSALTASSALAHPEDDPVDGEVATTDSGLIEAPPYANSSFDGEKYATHFSIRQDGSAEVVVLVTYYRDRWEKHRYPFSNEESRSYRAFEDEVVGAMEAMAADASEKTDRDMTVTLEKTNHHHDRAEGYTLQFEFVWTNFAESYDNGTYVVTEPFTSGHPVLLDRHDSRDHRSFSSVRLSAWKFEAEPYEVSLTGGMAKGGGDSVRFLSWESNHEVGESRMVFAPKATPTLTPTASPTLSESPTAMAVPSSSPAPVAEESGFPWRVLAVLAIAVVLVGLVSRRFGQD